MGVATELASRIFGISAGEVERSSQEPGGGNRKEAHDLGIREPLAHGPYALTTVGYKKYEDEPAKIAQAYNEMRAIGDTVAVPLMALSLTTEGEAAA